MNGVFFARFTLHLSCVLWIKLDWLRTSSVKVWSSAPTCGQLRSSDFGIPQLRTRLYILMLRTTGDASDVTEQGCRPPRIDEQSLELVVLRSECVP